MNYGVFGLVGLGKKLLSLLWGQGGGAGVLLA
jgi:hypothetical protein